VATLRDQLLPTVSSIRGIPGALGVRTTTVKRVVRTWTQSVRVGTYSDSILTFSPTPKVREKLNGSVLDVGPITPAMLGTGHSYADIRPTLTSLQECFWVTVSSNGTRQWELVDLDSSRPFRYQLKLQAAERTRPF